MKIGDRQIIKMISRIKVFATVLAAAGALLYGCSQDEEVSGENEGKTGAKAIATTNAALSQIAGESKRVRKLDSAEERRIQANRQKVKEIAKRREERRAKLEQMEAERAKREAMNPEQGKRRLSKRESRMEEKRKRREEARKAEEQPFPPAESETPEQAKIRKMDERRKLRDAALETRREYEESLTEEQLATYRRKSIGYWIALEAERKKMHEKHEAKREDRMISEDKQNTTTQQKE